MRKTLVGFAVVSTLGGACTTTEPPPTNRLEMGPPTPGTPRLDSITAGDRQVTVSFTPSGGTNFASVCRLADGTYAATGSASSSPVVVKGLDNGVEYSCDVTAFNGDKYSTPS